MVRQVHENLISVLMPPILDSSVAVRGSVGLLQEPVRSHSKWKEFAANQDAAQWRSVFDEARS